MSARGLGVLAFVCVALLLVALFDPWLSTPRGAGGRILDPSLETRISQIVVDDGSTRYLLARQGDLWWMEEPAAAPASAESVRKMIEAMMLLRSLREADIEKVGTPELVVEFKSDAGDGKLVLGASSADGRHRWLSLPASGKAQLVQAHLVDEILAASLSLISKKVLPFEIHNHKALRLQLGESWLQIEQESVSLAGTDLPMPLGARARDFRTALRALRFRSVELAPGSCDATKTLRVEHDGQEALLRACGPCDDASLAVEVGRRRGCLQPAAWQDLLRVVSEPSSIVDVPLLPARPQGFSLQCGAESVAVDPSRVDSARLLSWWQQLNASVQLVVPRRDFAVQCTLVLEQQKIDLGILEDSWFAATEGEGLMRLLGDGAGSLLEASALRFASLDLISEDPLFARRIEFRRALDSGWVLEREQLGDPWHDPRALIPGDRATPMAEALAGDLATLRAASYLDTEAAASSLARPDLQIELIFDSALGGKENDYLLRLAGDAQECRVSVNGGPVAQLAPPLCARLLALEP